MTPCNRTLHMSLIWDKLKVSPMLQWVSIHFPHSQIGAQDVSHRSIKNVTPLAMFPSTLHHVPFRLPFSSRLLTRSLPPIHPAKQEQKISDNSLVVVSTTPMRSLIRSPWNPPLLVELKWRSYSRPLMVSEAVFCQGTIFAPSQ